MILWTTTDPGVWADAMVARLAVVLLGAHLAGMAILDARRTRRRRPPVRHRRTL